MPTIDATRVLRDLYTAREIGRYETGVHRPTYTADDVRSRHWFAEQLTAAGLAAEIDGVGNIYGRDPSPGRKLLTGSHIETQNHAGWLDGILGLVYGLEAARVLGKGIDVAAFADEEGHFASFVGSRSFCGLLSEAEIDGIANRETGQSLRDALQQAGFAGRPRRQVDPARTLGYLEAHIEQGIELESTGRKIGVVTGIVGSKRYRLEFVGEQNHAGTTRMARRKDAGAALVKFLSAVETEFTRLASPITVWTAGDFRVFPGAQSVVPGRAELVFQWRDTDQERLDRMDAAFRALLRQANEGPCRVNILHHSVTSPAMMDPGMQAALTAAAEARVPGGHLSMPSGAGHDAQILSRAVPSAMLFVPSIGGISHHWTENTSDEDIVLGCQVFVDAAAAILAAA